MSGAFALGFSGGGDSTALLHALTLAFPDRTLHALIVDHGLRDESAEEAERNAAYARALGAVPTILPWSSPVSGQGAARQARHRLLAKACEDRGINLLCLGHTLDDRIETLRMRANRTGSWRTLTGMTARDASPIWPEGRSLVIARPFLGVRREHLRHWLKSIKASWVEDPSNDNPVYERVRYRADAYPDGSAAEKGLISLSEQSLDAERLLRASAHRLFKRAVTLHAWGGAQLHPALKTAVEPVALRVMEAALLAISGRSDVPAPAALKRFLDAFVHGQAMTSAGVLLSADGYMGRDPGAVLGRSDGGVNCLELGLKSGQAGVFDGRWQGRADRDLVVRALGDSPAPKSCDLSAVPHAHRSTLTGVFDSQTGEAFALLGVSIATHDTWSLLSELRVQRWLLPPAPPSWFDGNKCASIVG